MALFALLCLQTTALLAATRPCTSADTTFFCRLDSVLHLLSGIAVILGILLLLVACGAWLIYRRNKADTLLPR